MRSYPIRPDVKSARLNVLATMHAQRRGRADGRTAVTVPGPDEAWTPFIGQACASARKASNQMQAWLHETYADLVSTVYGRAEIVVRQHDGPRTLTDGARGRFYGSLTAWRIEAAAARARAEAAVDYSNQLIDCYWQAYLIGYLRGHAAGGRALADWHPVAATIDPIWDSIDALLLLSYGPTEKDKATSKAAETLLRALDIMADCTCPQCRGDEGGNN